MHALILIERNSPNSLCWSNLIKRNRMQELSVYEVISKYKGFEGELINYLLIDNNKDVLVKNVIQAICKGHLGIY